MILSIASRMAFVEDLRERGVIEPEPFIDEEAYIAACEIEGPNSPEFEDLEEQISVELYEAWEMSDATVS